MGGIVGHLIKKLIGQKEFGMKLVLNCSALLFGATTGQNVPKLLGILDAS